MSRSSNTKSPFEILLAKDQGIERRLLWSELLVLGAILALLAMTVWLEKR
jgi:hypothetical protein